MITYLGTSCSNGDPWPKPWITSFSGTAGTIDVQSKKLRMTTGATGGNLCICRGENLIQLGATCEIRYRLTPGQPWSSEHYFSGMIMDAWRTSANPNEPQNGYEAYTRGDSSIEIGSDVASTYAGSNLARTYTGSNLVRVVLRRVGGWIGYKIFDDGSPEPAGWTHTFQPTTPVSTGPWHLGFSLVGPSAAVAVRMDIDQISVDDLQPVKVRGNFRRF